MNEFMLFLDKFNSEHPTNVGSIRNILMRLKDEPDTTGMTAQEIIKEIRRRQQE